MLSQEGRGLLTSTLDMHKAAKEVVYSQNDSSECRTSYGTTGMKLLDYDAVEICDLPG